MTRSSSPGDIVRELDAETRELVTLAVTIGVGNEAVLRVAIETAA